MSNTIFDLKGFRENALKMTQSQFADLIGMRQDSISRLEKNPDQIKLEDLAKIAKCTGMDISQLINYQIPVPQAFSIKSTWTKAQEIKHSFITYLVNKKITLQTPKYTDDLLNLQNKIETIIQKPKVVFLGRSDSGKSTMINALLGKDTIPTGWTPTTSIIIYIKHIEDRPSFIEEELWIFKKGINNELWNEKMLNNESYCRNWKIASGNAEMLSKYGTHSGNNYEKEAIGSAVLFVDSDILKNCDLIDAPGFVDEEESDNTSACFVGTQADVLIYLSPSTSFMNGGDFSSLKTALKTLAPIGKNATPLSNLYVVATQGHLVEHGNPDTLNQILNNGCKRFIRTLTDFFWEEHNCETKDLYHRFFTYTTDIDSLRTKFEDDLRILLETIPSYVSSQSIEMVKEYCSDKVDQLENEISEYNRLLDDKADYETFFRSIVDNEPNRRASSSRKRAGMISEIKKLSTLCKNKFHDKYETIIEENHIVNLIDSKEYKCKKEDMQLLSSYLSSEMEDALKIILKEESDILTKLINNYLTSYTNDCSINRISNFSFNMNSFNAKRAFTSGLAGAATIGGLAFWASTLGNLGAYILVAKGVSLLSTLGISIGGTAAATAAVSSIGGPIVLGIALAVIATLSVFAILGGGWKKKTAKKIKEAYQEQNALEKFYEIIDQYWKDTESAFIIASDNMEKEWENYVNNIGLKLQTYNPEELKQNIKEANNFKTILLELSSQFVSSFTKLY